MTLALVSPSSSLIQVSSGPVGFGDENTMFRTPWPHPSLEYPPYLYCEVSI